MSTPQDRLASLGAFVERECPEVAFAYLFGSVASGQTTPRSDVDIAVYAVEAGGAANLRLDLARRISEYLGTDRVDVVVLNDAPLSLAGRILQGRRVIADRDPFLRHRYESLTARMFHDFRIREHRILATRFARG